MSITVCLCAKTLYYPDGGGHLWVYLNWALGLRALGCRVIWLERVGPRDPVHEVQGRVSALKNRLERYDLANTLALCSWTNDPLSLAAVEGCLDLEAAGEADLLLNLAYNIPPEVVERFRRSALVDIDPGLSQVWISTGQLAVARHDLYFTIGETVGQPGALFPDCGLRWHYTPPPVFLPAWPPTEADSTAPYTTITHWWGRGETFQGQTFNNGKRSGFAPFLDLPRRTTQPLELAISRGADDANERAMLRKRGWRVRDAHAIASTPWEYQHYIRNSRGEFSCAKPFYTRLQNGWTSDRTLCYLASGKPAVVQYTGPSRFLPDSLGLFRFRDLEEAVRCLETAAADYERQCKLARALAEEYFDARKVIGHVLELALA